MGTGILAGTGSPILFCRDRMGIGPTPAALLSIRSKYIHKMLKNMQGFLVKYYTWIYKDMIMLIIEIL